MSSIIRESPYSTSSIDCCTWRIITRVTLTRIIHRKSSTKNRPSRIIYHESPIESDLIQDYPSRAIYQESSIESHLSSLRISMPAFPTPRLLIHREISSKVTLPSIIHRELFISRIINRESPYPGSSIESHLPRIINRLLS